MAKLVKMEKDGLKADVHPDMVDDYKKDGYIEVKQAVKEVIKKAVKEVIKKAVKGSK